MKKILFAILLLSGVIAAHASEPAVISGTWNRGSKKQDSEVKLFKILSGRLVEISSFKLEEDNRFGFAFDPKGDGFYVIGSGSISSQANKYIFYFKPGDRLNIAVNDSTYSLPGKNTTENEALAQWHNFISPLEYKSVYFSSTYGRVNGMPSTYVDFFPMLEEYVSKVQLYKSNTGNKSFDQMFALYRNYDLLRYAGIFTMTPRTAHPEKEDYPDFYRNVNLNQLTSTTDLLLYPFGLSIIQEYLFISDKFEKTQEANPLDTKLTLEQRQKIMNETRDKTIAQINNDTIKGEMVLNYAERAKSYEEFQDLEKKYGKYILTPDQKNRESAIITMLSQKKDKNAELKTIDFTGTDINGKEVTLSSFKGKAVYVDVWATWCGPCKREIPYLKEVEKEYHGKDIVFLSISVDEVKKKQKWIDFVNKEELTGVQLFGGKGLESDVSKFYGINAIPRFMLFGKDGKIVTDDAPRPSEPTLKKLLDDQLKK